MRRESPGPPPGRPAIRLGSFGLRLQRDWSELEHVELGRALWPGDDQPPFERRNSLEYAGHVALRIVAIGDRLLLIAEGQAAKEHQPRRIIVLPQPTRGALGAGLLDDRQQVALDLDIAKERLEALVGPAPRRCLPELDQPAIIAARRRRGPRKRGSRAKQRALLADIARIGLARVGQGLLPGEAQPIDPVL